ncbi:hypothetical protein ACVXG9_27570 [Escherichia coli]
MVVEGYFPAAQADYSPAWRYSNRQRKGGGRCLCLYLQPLFGQLEKFVEYPSVKSMAKCRIAEATTKFLFINNLAFATPEFKRNQPQITRFRIRGEATPWAIIIN